jgi:tRNA(Ile)-lysidine synthase
MLFLATIEQYIEKHHLMVRGQGHRYLVGVSGGADSVCLLLALNSLGYDVEAVHCNFKLRGAESDRDEQFVVDLCNEKRINLHITHFDTRTYASLHKVSIEMAARHLRYAYFEQLRIDLGAEGICVAHHRDDHVETVLMNMLRGTGIEGLTGIKCKNGHVLRPLLCIGRHDVEQWLDEIKQPYVTDSTNMVDDVLRNKLRLNVLPMLEQTLSGALDGIERTSQWMHEVNNVYRASIENDLQRMVVDNTVDVASLLALPSSECFLFEWLTPLGFTPATVAAIHQTTSGQGMSLRSGLQWLSPTHQLVTHHGMLIVAPLPKPLPTLVIPETGTYLYNENIRITVKLQVGDAIATSADTASLDADKVHFPLTVRPMQKGDRFKPLGMKGCTKLVSDFLTDKKLTLIEKQQQLVLTDADGQIVWIVGRRPDDRCRITPHTKKTLLITRIATPTPNS